MSSRLQARQPLSTISLQNAQTTNDGRLLTPRKSSSTMKVFINNRKETTTNENRAFSPATPDEVHSSKRDPIHSPTLSKLRGGAEREAVGVESKIAAKQRELTRKHQEAKSNIENCPGLGGGVTLWPTMNDMRLSKRETIHLVFLSTFLTIGCIAVFYSLHGEAESN